MFAKTLVLKYFFSCCIFFLLPFFLVAQQRDTSVLQKDSLKARDSVIKKDSAAIKDTLVNQVVKKVILPDRDSAFFSSSRFFNLTAKPEAAEDQRIKKGPQDFNFALLLGVLFLLSFLRLFYRRYFNNLFRVFFNTSLRQSQLTDQLLQAKQASLLFNIFFVLTGGIYSYLLLRHFNLISPAKMIAVMASCVGVLALIYMGKFIVLKFTGWLTGLSEATDTYLFVIFLINKIIGVLLVPVIIIISFSESTIVKVIISVSLLLIILLVILRFFRSYGLLQNQLKVSRFHFLLYIIGIEVVPLLLIYKSLMIFVK